MTYLLMALASFLFVSVLTSFLFRRVVDTNMVHIVQRKGSTTSYGTGLESGNVYYDWPSSIPLIGCEVIRLPVSNFDLRLEEYEAYDINRVPFVVDVTAFFRIEDTTKAAQRVASIKELEQQLTEIVRGSVRKVLASANIDEIMLERAVFGDKFTTEVEEQLREWGVKPVKSMELMDIRDGGGSQVVANIMAKKTSLIERESREEVAENNRSASMKEIEAKRDVDLQAQEAQEAVGQRVAVRTRTVGLAEENAKQEVLQASRETMERAKAVDKVNAVREAEIQRDAELVKADQDKRATIIRADGQLAQEQRIAEAVLARGKAKAEAEKLLKLAPVQAKIALAQEIGENQGYQDYLIKVEQVKATIEVGVAQAQALTHADVRVVSTAGTPAEGISDIGSLFTPKGGAILGSALETFGSTDIGEKLLGKLTKEPKKANGGLQ